MVKIMVETELMVTRIYLNSILLKNDLGDLSPKSKLTENYNNII